MSTQHATQAEATEWGADSAAGKVMRTVADRLADHGLDVRGPECEWGSHYLKITNPPSIVCDVAISEGASAQWEYRLGDGSQADPALITGIVLGILGASPTQPKSMALPQRHPNLTPKSIAGRALVDHGMQVCLEVHKDECFFEAWSDIEVTNPAQPSRGTVRITDDSSILWECRFNEPAASIGGIDPEDFAGTIANIVTG